MCVDRCSVAPDFSRRFGGRVWLWGWKQLELSKGKLESQMCAHEWRVGANVPHRLARRYTGRKPHGLHFFIDGPRKAWDVTPSGRVFVAVPMRVYIRDIIAADDIQFVALRAILAQSDYDAAKKKRVRKMHHGKFSSG